MNRLFATLGVLVLTGCLVPSGPDRGGGGPTAEPGKGQLEVRWTGEREARGILGSLWASSTADVYELVLVGSSGNRAVDLSLGSGQVVSLDPGTYRVMVLAGVKRSSGSTYAYLVGSALAEAVTVHDGQRSAVDLTLKSIDLGLAAKSPAYWKGTVTMTTAGKSRNPRLGMLLAGTSTTARPRFKSVELWNGYREMTSVTGTPDDWTAEATGTVPDGAAGFTVALVGAG
ncbi:MAG TPA: hypothetical protein VMB23_08155, partial [Spirochaetia bacterium]|nr:hypothetical protein [Spirochaetia bacterium]